MTSLRVSNFNIVLGTKITPTHCWNSNGVASFRPILLFPHLLCSTSITTTTTTTTTRSIPSSTSEDSDSLSSLTNWLVDSLGLSQEQALSTSSKLTQYRQSQGAKKVCSPNLLRNAHLVVSFFQQNGLEIPQIRIAIYSAPRILTCRIEQNLEPKMKFFQELGFSVSDFARLISTQHRILDVGLDSTIRPAVQDLRAIMGTDENVVRVLKRFRWNAQHLVTRHLVLNVSALQAEGIPIESIQKRILRHSTPYMRKPEDFKEIMARAETKWGISSRSPNFLSAVHVLCCLNEKTIESKCRVFESFGWDRSEVEDLFRLRPMCLTLSEGNIKDKLCFYMYRLGYDPRYLIPRSAMLTCGLEKRVVPRYLVFQLLKEKGLIRCDLSFYTVVTMSESRFLVRFVQPFEDDIPDLLHTYTKSISSSTQRQNKSQKNTFSYYPSK